mgnify:CR=1 FL=1|tara:strand:- start:56502 stop:58211 length:1710 start_codon:yes stop_codon:yes gene_type:complete
MNIPIEELEQKFLSTALKNGLSYWKKDQFEVIDDSTTSLKARVYGTDEYLSELMFLNNVIVDVNCNCPNNRTLFCKHIAILYYEKLKDVLDLKKSKSRKATKKTSKKTSKKKIEQNAFSIEIAIQNLSAAKLKEIVLQELKDNVDFRLRLENKFNPKYQSKQELYQFYKTEIQAVLTKHKRRGYIDYTASNSVGRVVVDYADTALEYYENSMFEASFEICKAIIDTMIKPLEYTDTSSGLFYQGLDESLNIALNLANTTQLKPALRKNMYTFFVKLFKDKKTHGWGYETNFIDILIPVSETNKHKEELLDAIYDIGIDRHTIQLYNIIKKFDGEKAAKAFVIEHKALPEFRAILFDEFMENKDYEAAKQCMYEGIKVNEESRGIVINWIENLLAIAEITNDKNLAIKSAKSLFLNLRFRVYPNEVDYYEILKSQYTAEAWKIEWPLLVEKTNDKATLEEIYFRENQLDLLFESISEKQDFYYGPNHLNFNHHHIAVLLPKYNEPFEQLLKSRIVDYIDVYKGKNYYKEVCTTLIAFKKQGLDINGIIIFLKENYHRRPSLMGRLHEYFE